MRPVLGRGGLVGPLFAGSGRVDGKHLVMMKPAFSTVACPEWTLSQVAERAQACGFEAVELRTFGDGSTDFACDPALTDGAKVRRVFSGRGIEILSLATSVRFDEPVFPPVIGHAISDTEKSVRAGKRAIDVAVAIECPFVRVFGFEYPAREKRAAALARIADRLGKVIDHADKSGVRVVVENGGSFSSAAEVMELIRAVDGPLVGVCYNLAAARLAASVKGEAWRVEDDVAQLGDKLLVARIKDLKDGMPCELGRGDVPCERLVRALHAADFDGPVVYEWDRAWRPELAPAEQVLAGAAGTIWSWLGGRVPAAAAGAANAGHNGSPVRGAAAGAGGGRRK